MSTEDEADPSLGPGPACLKCSDDVQCRLVESAFAMTYQGLTNVVSAAHPHLGGNAAEGDPFTYAHMVWDYMIRRFALASVLDLGSGLGYASDYFHRAGVRVLAVDGMPENVEKAIFPTVQIDLTDRPVVCKVDLVHCQEVVEHIEEQHLDNALRTLTCGRFILMTNALPAQGGHHHVNEQPTEYWIDHLKRRGCDVLVEDTSRVRALAANDKAKYIENTGLVLVNKARL